MVTHQSIRGRTGTLAVDFVYLFFARRLDLELKMAEPLYAKSKFLSKGPLVRAMTSVAHGFDRVIVDGDHRTLKKRGGQN